MRRIPAPAWAFSWALLATMMVPLDGAFAATEMSAAHGTTGTAQLLDVPVSSLPIHPQAPQIENPYAGDKTAVQRGEELFSAMNCIGCHAPEGGGGMGPPLSDSQWIYGGQPAQIYLSIMQGRPNGMPAWGGTLPSQSIWELVTYIETLHKPKSAYEQQTPLTGSSESGEKPPGEDKGQ